MVDPILSVEDAEKDYPMYGLEDICRYFINDLQYLASTYVSQAFDITIDTPMYGSIQSIDSRFLFFPLNVLLGDLHLWLASSTQSKSEARLAAQSYYSYLNTRNGSSACPTNTNFVRWPKGTTSYMMKEDSYISSFSPSRGESNYSNESELITIIPGDSLPSDDNYSQLRNIFNSTSDNDFKASVTPSQGLIELSEAQKNCLLSNSGVVSYAPATLTKHQSGDLRLSSIWFSPSRATFVMSVS